MPSAPLSPRVPFASINRSSSPDYCEGWVRHHLQPRSTLRHPVLGGFLTALRVSGFHNDDFETNGILLPVLASVGKATGLPLHVGGHPNYNAHVIDELQQIRSISETLRTDSRLKAFAMAGVRGLQARLRAAIISQNSARVDFVLLSGRTDQRLDAMIDQLIASLES